MSFRDLKDRSRLLLHEALSFPASYYYQPDSEPVLIRARKHITNPVMQGGVKGTNLSYAETAEAPTKLVFSVKEALRPIRGGLVIFSGSEGYVIDLAHVAYGVTVTVEVSPMNESDIASFALPETLS